MESLILVVATAIASTGPFDVPVPGGDAETELVEQRVELADGGVVVRLSRRYRGMPVLGENVAVRISANGDELYRTGRFSNLGLVPGPRIDGAQASRAALAHLLRASVEAPTLPHALAIRPEPARLVYVVHVTAGVPQWRRSVLVDAVSGAVIEVRSPVHHAMANVFDPHPSAADVLGDPDEVELLGLAADTTTLNGEFVESRGCLTDDDTVRVVTCNDVAGGIGCLSPEVADLLVAFCGEDFTAVRTQNDDFRFPAADDVVDYDSDAFTRDPFAEVNAYYHVDRTARFSRALGHTPEKIRILSNVTIPSGTLLQCASQAWASSTSRTADDARAALAGCTSNAGGDFIPFDNAFFLGDELEFLVGIRSGVYMGQGSAADFSYDGDIVSHEYGHAIEARVGALLGGVLNDAIGVNVEPGALAEAYADYLAATLTEDPEIGGYVSARRGQPGGIRALDHSLVCPEYVEGQVHADSVGFSGALWAARQRYPQTEQREGLTLRVFDRVVYQALTTLSMTSTMSDFAAAVVAEVENENLLADPNAESVREVFTARNVLECERIRAVPVDWIFMPSGATSEIGGFIGGQSFTPYAPGPFQIRLVTGPTRAAAASFRATETNPTLTFENPEDLLGGFGESADTDLALLVRFGQPVEFSYANGANGTAVSIPDDVVEYPLLASGPVLATEIDLSGANGRDVYGAVVNRGVGVRLRDLTVELGPEVLEEPNAGGEPADGGCAAVPGAWLLLLRLRRRRRRV